MTDSKELLPGLEFGSKLVKRKKKKKEKKLLNGLLPTIQIEGLVHCGGRGDKKEVKERKRSVTRPGDYVPVK